MKGDRGFTEPKGQAAPPAPAGRLLLFAVALLAGCRSAQQAGSSLVPPDLSLPEAALPSSAEPSARAKGGPARATVSFAEKGADGVLVQAQYTDPWASQGEAAPPAANDDSFLVLPALQPVLSTSLIDLPSALRLAGAENPTIALAEEAVRASLAEQLRAQVLLLPDLSAGFNYDYHDGRLQAAKGIIRDVTRQALYAGAGAGAIAAGTVGIPGIRITAQLADAIYAPQAARERVVGRRFDAVATRHNLLLEVALRYLDLEGAQARLLALRQSETEFGKVQTITADFAQIGQGRRSDADRARTELSLLRNAIERVAEEIQVQAAELARLLNVDPSFGLRAENGLPAPLRFVDPREDLENLIQRALNNRPEIGARTADVVVNETRLRQERVRPLVPFISIGFSAGEFGGGSNLVDTGFGHFGGRTDVDALAVWSFQNLGLGNLAVQRRVRAELREAMAERIRTVNLVRREVTEALALVRQREAEIAIARKRVETSQEAYRLDLIRVRNGQGRPIEVLNSARLLNAARQDLIAAVVGHNQAQFQLLVALGNPPG
jgi:outer membrane protein TolC